MTRFVTSTFHRRADNATALHPMRSTSTLAACVLAAAFLAACDRPSSPPTPTTSSAPSAAVAAPAAAPSSDAHPAEPASPSASNAVTPAPGPGEGEGAAASTDLPKKP